jgi:hypothetical protein
MPKIPRIMPSGNTLTTEPQGAFQKTTSANGEIMQSVGKEISNYGDMFTQANNLSEKTKAQNDLNTKLNDIHSRAEADTDTSAERKSQYDKEIDSAREESSKFITLPQERELYSLEASSKAEITRNRVNNSFMRKADAQAKVDLDIYLDNKKNDFIKAESYQEKQMAIVERDSKISEMVRAGRLDPSSATALLDFQRKDWAKSQVEYDIGTNPELARDILSDKQYPDIAEEDRVKYLKDAERAVEQNKIKQEKQIKEETHINSASFLNDVSQGKFQMFNIYEINSMANSGEISNEAASAAIRAIEKPISAYDIKPDDEAFLSRVNGVFEIKDKESLEKNLIEILNGSSFGKINNDQMTLLFQAAQKHGEGRVTEFRDNYKRLSDWGVDAGIPTTYKSQVAQDYLAGINSGKSPSESAETAMLRATASQNEILEPSITRIVGADPKEALGFTDKFLTNPVMGTLLENVQKFSQNRIVRNIGLGQAGVVGGVGGAAKIIGLKSFGDAVSKESKLMQKTFEIKDPTFLDKLTQGASSSLSFFVPGAAISKGVTFLKAAPIIATALGVGTSSVLESAVEGGGNYEEALSRGMTEEEAKNIGSATFWLNMPLLVGTNIVGGLFTPQGKAIKETAKKWTFDRISKAVVSRGIKPSLAEGTQEGLQQVAGNISIGDPAGQDVKDSVIIGAIVGGGMGAIMSAEDTQQGGKADKEGDTSPFGDSPKDNIVRDKSGKEISFNMDAYENMGNEIANQKAIISGALSGIETITNGGNSKDVALNTAIASNLEIIGGFTNAENKLEAAKSIDKSVYEYLMQGGMAKEEAAALSKTVSEAAIDGLVKDQNSQKYKDNLINALSLAIPSWRFTAPAVLSTQSKTLQEQESKDEDSKEAEVLKKYAEMPTYAENVKKAKELRKITDEMKIPEVSLDKGKILFDGKPIPKGKTLTEEATIFGMKYLKNPLAIRKLEQAKEKVSEQMKAGDENAGGQSQFLGEAIAAAKGERDLNFINQRKGAKNISERIKEAQNKVKSLPKEVTSLSTDDLEKLILRRYEVGASQQEIDLLETEYSERVSEENILMSEADNMGSDLTEVLSEQYSKYLNALKEGSYRGSSAEELRDSFLSVAKEISKQPIEKSVTNDQAFEAAKDIYEYKQKLLERQRGGVKNEKSKGKEGVQEITTEPGATPASEPRKNVAATGSVEDSKAYQRALERYSEELKDQPEASYTTISLADQMARAFEFVNNNLALAKKIAYGMEPAPAGLKESAISIAYNEKMFLEGNIKEFGKSYRSRSLRQTARGQEIVLERAAEVNQNHPLYFARQVIEARTALAGKKMFDVKTKTEAPAKLAYKKIKAEAASVKKEIVDVKKLDIAEAQKIIDELTC